MGNEVNGDSEDVEALTSCGGQKHLPSDLLNEVRKALSSSWARRGRSISCKFADRSKLNILKTSRALDALEESHFTQHTVMIPKGRRTVQRAPFFRRQLFWDVDQDEGIPVVSFELVADVEGDGPVVKWCEFGSGRRLSRPREQSLRRNQGVRMSAPGR